MTPNLQWTSLPSVEKIGYVALQALYQLNFPGPPREAPYCVASPTGFGLGLGPSLVALGGYNSMTYTSATATGSPAYQDARVDLWAFAPVTGSANGAWKLWSWGGNVSASGTALPLQWAATAPNGTNKAPLASVPLAGAVGSYGNRMVIYGGRVDAMFGRDQAAPVPCNATTDGAGCGARYANATSALVLTLDASSGGLSADYAPVTPASSTLPAARAGAGYVQLGNILYMLGGIVGTDLDSLASRSGVSFGG